MERNKWETAIRCLEIALHPNTGDDEVIAAVNGFRRTTGGRRLRDICAVLANTEPAAAAAPRGDEPSGLARENRELRRKLAAAEQASAGTAAALRDGAADIAKLRDELRAARHAGAAAERRFAAFQLTQVQTVDRLTRDNAELRRALDAARPAMSSFGTALASALGRSDARPQASLERPPRGAALPARRGAAWVA